MGCASAGGKAAGGGGGFSWQDGWRYGQNRQEDLQEKRTQQQEGAEKRASATTLAEPGVCVAEALIYID
jgi:hypothetical protein